MDMAKCILHEKGLPKRFWAEAAHTLVFLLNKLATRALKKKTPHEAWHDTMNLKVLGFICYSYVPLVKRDKHYERAEPGIFIGYSSVCKAYRVSQRQKGKIMVNRNVHFLERRAMGLA